MTAENAGRPDVPARRRTLASAVMAGAALLLAAVAAHAQDAHGAIAFGQVAQGGAVAYGLAWDYAARDDAQEAAVNACLDGGGSDCAVLAWFQNGCGALAIDQYGMAQGKGARSLDRAEARVLQTCEAAGGIGCAVVVSQCVSQGGRPDTWSGSESVLAPPEPEEEPGPAAAGTAAAEQPASQEATEPVAARNQVLYFAAAGPKCADSGSTLTFFDRCWEEIQSRQGCFVWTRYNDRARVEDWTGGCSGDTAHGTGSLSYASASSREVFRTDTGALMHGKRNGHWVARSANGTWEGFYVDGKENGHWVIRYNNGERLEGSIVDDEWHGHWVIRNADGSVEEGPYVYDKQHGHWVFREADGDVNEGPYVDGEKHGQWVIRFADGDRLEYEYRNGSKEGQSGVYQTSDGNRYPGRWSGDCFRDAEGRALAWQGTKEDACGA